MMLALFEQFGVGSGADEVQLVSCNLVDQE
jgi:hypothetical protein